MRRIGTRREPEMAARPDGLLLAQGARFSETISSLAPSTFIPKGIYRFKSHDEADRHQRDCLVRGMARLAEQRK